MKWAMEQTIVTSPSDRHVLLIIANSARADGTAAFQAISRIAAVTGLSDRSVQRCIQRLLDVGAIRPGNEVVRNAHLPRADRRPNTYDVAIERGDTVSPGKSTGCHPRQNGVTLTTERGDTVSPNPSLPQQTPTDDDAREPPTVDLSAEPVLGEQNLPSWVPLPTWREFYRHRAVIRKPLSISGMRQVVRRLDELRGQGHDIGVSLEQTMAAGLAIPVIPRNPDQPGDSHANRNSGRKISTVERTETALQSFLAEHGA